MVGFLDGKGNGGIEVVGFGGPGAFSLFFSSSLRALLCTHTHTHSCPLILANSPHLFLLASFHQTRPTPFPGST